MLNHIVIMGRLTRDPELRRTGSGVAVAGFTVAVDRDYAQQGQERETDFIDCGARLDPGEICDCGDELEDYLEEAVPAAKEVQK